jgi:hypothetical protein
MLKVLTPARLATALGVLSGLGAAVTALVGVVPQESAVGRAVVGAAGVLGSSVTLVKYLEGEASWEQQQSAQAHQLVLSGLAPAPNAEVAVLPADDEPIEPARLAAQVPAAS